MNTKDKYLINRSFLVLFGILVISVIVFTFIQVDDAKILRLSFGFLFLYFIVMLATYEVYFDMGEIVSKITVFPFKTIEKRCNLSNIRKLSYTFVIFEEIGNFIISPIDGENDKTIVVNFIVNDRKRLIQKILFHRPDLELDDWIKEKILNYKIIRWKFIGLLTLLVLAFIGLMAIISKIL